MKNFTIAIPVFNDWDNLNRLLKKINLIAKKNSFEFNILIINDFSGILVPVRDEYNLANAIKKLLDNSKLAEKYGCNARVIVEKAHSVKKINNEILKIYTSCLDN